MHNECKRCVPEKEYCTQKANACASAKTALRSAKGPQTAEKAESEKRGLFHSPIFHITCIIRNDAIKKADLLSLPLSSSETRL